MVQFSNKHKRWVKDLEKYNLQIICNGSARNVYPSAMQFSMGNTRKAYQLYPGKQAAMNDLVDIFDCDENLEFTSVEKQINYFNDWIKSFSKSND